VFIENKTVYGGPYVKISYAVSGKIFQKDIFNLPQFEFRSGVLDTTLCDKVCQWLATGQWLSPGTSTNKTDRHDITEILLKVTLNIITRTPFNLQKKPKFVEHHWMVTNKKVGVHYSWTFSEKTFFLFTILPYMSYVDLHVWPATEFIWVFSIDIKLKLFQVSVEKIFKSIIVKICLIYIFS
jgi:hypothetical protein